MWFWLNDDCMLSWLRELLLLEGLIDFDCRRSWTSRYWCWIQCMRCIHGCERENRFSRCSSVLIITMRTRMWGKNKISPSRIKQVSLHEFRLYESIVLIGFHADEQNHVNMVPESIQYCEWFACEHECILCWLHSGVKRDWVHYDNEWCGYCIQWFQAIYYHYHGRDAWEQF